jgi:spore photoproduct lyase
MVKRFVPDSVWIERGEYDTPLARIVRARCGDRPVRLFEAGERPAVVGGVRDAKRTLVLQRHRGGFLRHCPAGTSGLVCCNYLVVNLASNCPMDCSYCFLQDYLADTPLMTAYTNVDDALAEVDALLHAHPQRTFRIGTGELADSLALDPITGLSRALVSFFAARANARLELKTKTDCIEELLTVDPHGRVVVSWSVNAEAVIARDEPGTASLTERLAAVRQVQAAGYGVGFHFDPLIAFDGWERGYAAAVEAIADTVAADAIAWISLGSLRLSPALIEAIRRERGASAVLGSELAPGPDGKARLWRGLRLRMYRLLIDHLRRAFATTPVYLCMEPSAVWERVMGAVPSDRALGMRLAAGTSW